MNSNNRLAKHTRIIASLTCSLLLLIFTSSCGPGPSGSSANPGQFGSVDYSVDIKNVSPLIYEFTIKTNRQFPVITFSVYGLQSGETAPPNTSRARLAHITDASAVGSKFQVTFQASDVGFGFYADDFVGGVATLSVLPQNRMIQGTLSP